MRNFWRHPIGRLVVVAAAWVGGPYVSSAAPCVNATLSAYIGLAFAGCTVGPDTLSNFQVLPGTTGATELSPTDILLSPSFGPSAVVLAAAANATSATGMVQEILFTYQLSGSSYIGSSITLSASSETGDGAVAGLKNFCADGIFISDGVSGCTGRAGALATVDGFQNQDSASFSPASLLSVTDDLIIDGGLGGSAHGGTLSNQFTTVAAVPEPAPVLLIAIGLSLAAMRRLYIR